MKISIDFPLKGEWQLLQPPRHHPYAYDFLMKDNDRKKYHKQSVLYMVIGKINSDQYYCWNQPIYTLAEGEVFQIGKINNILIFEE